MDKKFEDLPSEKLKELYLKNKEFIDFLNKEYENTKKMRENK